MTDRMIPTLTMTDLTTGYRSGGRNYKVAEHLSASLYPGELTCLIGANGCGKSTLLRTLTAFLSPLSGQVQIGERQLSDYSRAQLSRLVGVVLTDRIDVRDLRVADLVAMGRMPYTGFWGHLTDEDRRQVNAAIDLVGIRALERRWVHSLSDGEMQKVLVAKTLAQETPFIFLDEPTAFLDYPSKVELFLLLRRLAREQRKTVFLSTHDLDLVLQMADRLWLLDRDHGLHTGVPEDLVAQGIFNGFFPHPHLSFSARQMAYQVHMPVIGQVRVAGEEGERRDLLQKALWRVGLQTVADGSASVPCIRVSSASPYYHLTDQAGTSLETHLIEEVLRAVSACLSVAD